MLTFDIERSRAFYIELREMTSGSLAGVFEISRSEGEPPLQALPVEEEKKETKPKKITAEVPSGEQSKTRKKLNEEATPDEYGSEAFDSSEIDPEGFGTSDESGEFDNEIPTEDFSL